MNDERLERELRDALVREDPGPLPTTLRSSVSSIPDEVSPRGASVNRSRRSQLMTAVAAVATVVLAGAVIVVGVGMHNATIGHASSQSPGPSSQPGRTAAAPALGTRWVQVPATGALAGAMLSDVVAFTGGFVAVGTASSPSLQPGIWTSPDGTHWTRDAPPSVGGQLATIVSLAVGGPGLVGVGYAGDLCRGTAEAFTSSDGVHWAAIDLPISSSGYPFAADQVA